jgi:hypothetical protein
MTSEDFVRARQIAPGQDSPKWRLLIVMKENRYDRAIPSTTTTPWCSLREAAATAMNARKITALQSMR